MVVLVVLITVGAVAAGVWLFHKIAEKALGGQDDQ